MKVKYVLFFLAISPVYLFYPGSGELQINDHVKLKKNASFPAQFISDRFLTGTELPYKVGSAEKV